MNKGRRFSDTGPLIVVILILAVVTLGATAALVLVLRPAPGIDAPAVPPGPAHFATYHGGNR